MKETFRLLYALLSVQERKRAVLVFILILAVAISETMGVASVLPFISVLSNADAARNNRVIAYLYHLSGIDGEELFTRLLGIGFIVITIISLAIRAVSTWAQIKFSKMRVHSVGARLLEKYLRQPYVWYLNEHTSRLATKVLSEVNGIISNSLFPALQLVSHAIIVIALFLLLVAVEPLLAFTALVCLGSAYGLIYLLFRKKLIVHGELRYVTNLERYKVVQEIFGGIKDVKIIGLEQNMLERFRKPSYQTISQEVIVEIIKQIPGIIMQGMLVLGVVGMLLYLKSSHGTFSEALPSFTVFAFAGYRLMPSLQQIYRHLSSIRSTMPALESLVKDLESFVVIYPMTTNRQDGQTQCISGDIELRSIQYRYPNAKKPVLHLITMSIPEFAKIGIAGTTGSGKTTLVDIILGLLDPDEGEINVGGIKISPDNIRKWQNNLGYVPQHIYLADMSVAGNIAFGVPEKKIDMEAVKKAATIANLDKFITEQLPSGYETVVGERGVRLSGGQRQRIGIARALYYNPKVLILDEATSALDNITEDAVMSAVNNLGNSKTIIMIAHRLSTLRKCDVIYLLEHGVLVDQGDYATLVLNNEKFRKMAEKDV